MNIRVIANSLYGLAGIVTLMVGASVLLLTTGLLSAVISDFIVKFGHDDPTTLHIIQELGSVLIFVGLITFGLSGTMNRAWFSIGLWLRSFCSSRWRTGLMFMERFWCWSDSHYVTLYPIRNSRPVSARARSEGAREMTGAEKSAVAYDELRAARLR